MEEKQLYPMHICPILDEYEWGGEEFKLADLGYRDSLIRDGWLAANTMGEVMDTYMDRVVGDNAFEFSGRQFPVCLRVLHIDGDYPLQVHPDDEVAAQRYDFLGKEKFWYVLDAGKNAVVYAGFVKPATASGLLKAVEKGSERELLNAVAPHRGQLFHFSPGTVHAASGKLEILEIAQSSPLDFCISGMGHQVSEGQFDPSLGLVDALDFIDYGAWKADDCSAVPQFAVNAFKLSVPLQIGAEKLESFIVYYCTGGEASVQLDVMGQKAVYLMKKGETLLIPAEVTEFVLAPLTDDAAVVEVLSPYREEQNAYINPDVPATLEE